MARRLHRVDITWTPDLAYAIGVITTDGNLSPDMRHINITSKDHEMVETMRKILRLTNSIGKKARGGSLEKKYFVLQFGDKRFYEFLLSIGLTPRKSKTLGKIEIPDVFFPDFLRGCIDGDGSIGFFIHPESKQRQIRVRLYSASPIFLAWMHASAKRLLKVSGGRVYVPKKKSVQSLYFSKADSRIILRKMYYTSTVPSLARKRIVAEELLKGE